MTQIRNASTGALDPTSAQLRLNAALGGLAVTFRGMTARPDETNCECHWGSAEELALLKVPDVELDPDLLRRTWWPFDWADCGSVLRRILPQLANTLVRGQVETHLDLCTVGQSFARGHWQQWPAEQTAAVWEFLEAWWTQSLIDPNPTVPAYQVFEFCAEASGTLSPWLSDWETATHPVADHCLAEAVAQWADCLLVDELPWSAWDDEQVKLAELTAWLVRHAPARIRADGVRAELLHRVRLLGLTGPARWDDPHWPA